MFFEIIFAIIIGCILGSITGLIPGLHTNLISVIILSLIPFLSKFLNPFFLIIIIFSMGLMHTFLDIIPATFLGIPDSGSLESALPAHRLVSDGKGLLAIRIGLFGSYSSLLFTVIMMPVLILILEFIVSILEEKIIFILFIPIIVVSLKEYKWKKLLTFVSFLMSGLFAFFVFNISFSEPLLPLFTGFFGLSSILLSIFDNNVIPFQKDVKFSFSKPRIFIEIIKSFFAGGFTGILPGIGNSQAALINCLKPKNDSNGELYYIFLTAGINTVNFAFSLLALFLLDKSRNGTILAIQKMIGELPKITFIYLVLIAILVGSLGYLFGILLSKKIIIIFQKISYQYLSIGISIFLVLIVLFVSGISGILILVFSTALGVFVQLKEIPRSSLMGSILIPVILYYIF